MITLNVPTQDALVFKECIELAPQVAADFGLKKATVGVAPNGYIGGGMRGGMKGWIILVEVSRNGKIKIESDLVRKNSQLMGVVQELDPTAA